MSHIEVPEEYAQTQQDRRRAAGDFTEAASAVSSIESAMGGLENQSDLFARKGIGIVDEMMCDGGVGTFIEMKKVGALSSPWKIKPAVKDDPEAVRQADFVTAMLERMPGALIGRMHEMLSSIEYGYSVTNIVLDDKPIAGGDWAGMFGLKGLRTKRPHEFRFDTDPYRNIKPDGIIHTMPDGTIERLARERFAIYTYAPRFNDPYGTSDLARVYPHWNSKRWMLRFWDMYAERFAGGTVVAKWKQADNPSEGEFNAVSSFIKNKSIRSGLKVSDAWTVDFHEASGTGADIFEASVNHHNRAIARAIFLPDLLGFSESKPGGAFALGQKHFDLFIMVLTRLQSDLAEVVMQEQVIKTLIDINFGMQDAYPKFVFEPLTNDQKAAWLTGVFTAIEKGALVPDPDIERAVREMLDLPTTEQSATQGPQDPQGPPPPSAGPVGGRGPVADMPGNTAAENELHAHAAVGELKVVRTPTTYERKVDLPGIVKLTNQIETAFVDTWSAQYQRRLRSVIDFARKQKIVTDGNATAIDQVKLPGVVEVRRALQRLALVNVYNGALQAQREIKRAGGQGFIAEPSPDEFAAVPATIALDQIAQVFVKAGLSLTPAVRAAARRASAKSIFVAGAESDKVLTEVRQILFTGLERADGNWTEGQLKKTFSKYLLTGEVVDAKLGAAYRNETIARNFFTTWFNAGRRSTFEDPKVEDFVVAYQWSSVLDDSTTAYCMSMDNRVLRKEELNAEGWPPAHHNCRSVVVPVTQGEKFTFDKIPRNVSRGAGFSMRV